MSLLRYSVAQEKNQCFITFVSLRVRFEGVRVGVYQLSRADTGFRIRDGVSQVYGGWGWGFGLGASRTIPPDYRHSRVAWSFSFSFSLPASTWYMLPLYTNFPRCCLPLWSSFLSPWHERTPLLLYLPSTELAYDSIRLVVFLFWICFVIVFYDDYFVFWFLASLS